MFSKIEMGGMQYVMKPFDFGKQVQELEKDLSIVADKKELSFLLKQIKKNHIQ